MPSSQVGLSLCYRCSATDPFTASKLTSGNCSLMAFSPWPEAQKEPASQYLVAPLKTCAFRFTLSKAQRLSSQRTEPINEIFGTLIKLLPQIAEFIPIAVHQKCLEDKLVWAHRNEIVSRVEKTTKFCVAANTAHRTTLPSGVIFAPELKVMSSASISMTRVETQNLFSDKINSKQALSNNVFVISVALFAV